MAVVRPEQDIRLRGYPEDMTIAGVAESLFDLDFFPSSVVSGVTRLVRIGGAFVEKPLMIKVGGTFVEKAVQVKVGGIFV